jgi:PAS domain S-box-containing protein
MNNPPHNPGPNSVAEALRESEEKFRSLVECALDGIMILTLEGTIIFANNTAKKILGFHESTSLNGINVMEFVALESRADVTRDFIEVTNGHDGYLAQYAVITAGGSRVWVESIGKKILYEGKPADIISFRDITPRRLAEEALRESEERYRLIFESLEDLYYQSDAQGVITVLSPSAWQMTGWRADELIGRPVADVYASPADRARLLEDIAKTGCVCDYELVLRKQDGTPLPVSLTAHVIRSPDGRPSGEAGILRDITLRKQKDQALRLANMKLNLFSSITRHDIRNQILALNAYLGLCEQALDMPALLAEYLERERNITRAIERQIGFTRDYEKMAMSAPAWQDIKACISTAVASLPLQDVRLVLDIPDIEIMADPLLEKVFYNLTDNALRYGGEGLNVVRLTCNTVDGFLILTFEDDGEGISDEDKEAIFVKGFGKNTGLGLFLVREILGISGISIHETGAQGKGARFEISIPEGTYRFIF